MHLLFLQSIYCQDPSNMKDYLSQRFLNYCRSVPREEVFVHTDRDEYISGEELWFNVYLIDRQSLKPSSNSRIVYFELLNATNRPVIQRRILVDNVCGPGQITLPDTLSSGLYTIRAYTSWMKNFLPENCFMKDINVYNTLSSKTFKGSFHHVNFIKKRTDNAIGEGVKNSGVTLKVNNSRHDSLEIFLTANDKFRSENNNIFYIFIQTHGNINLVSNENMSGDSTRVSIPKTLMSSGINQITIFNSKGKPVCERYIYTPAKKNAGIKLQSVDSCSLRNKITLDIALLNRVRPENNLSNLSISVSPASSESELISMDDYLVFGTEYGLAEQHVNQKRNLRDLSSGFMDSTLLNIKSNWLDWPSILSDAPLHLKYQVEKEDHHLLGQLLTSDQQPVSPGELLLMDSPGKEAMFQYARTDSEGNFSFDIHIDEELKDIILIPDDVSENHKIIIRSSFSDQYPKSEVVVDSNALAISPYISRLSVNNQVQKIYENLSTGDLLNPILQPIKPLRFYGKPDIELNLADYISLPVMSEVIFELLPGVAMKKKKSTYEMSITYYIGDDLFVVSPTLMIDGVIIKDPSMIANLDPENVEKIDVIREKYVVGKYFFPGILNVITKAADFNSVSIPDYMIRLSYRVIDPVRSFSSPDYSLTDMKESHIPDYRNTLYWNPSVKPGSDGKARVEFWSSDNKSDYVVNIEGITQEGNILSLKKIIRVK